MEKGIILSPSILSADFGHLADQILQMEEFGADWIHVDVMDGQFVPNITMGPFIVNHCRRLSKLPIDVHLMIEKPENHIEAFLNAGAQNLSIHIENNPNVYRTLQQIKELGGRPGIVLNPGTPADAIANVIDLVDLVLVMTVNPGFSGQPHMPHMAQKVQRVAEMIRHIGRNVIIEVDGGISAETLPDMKRAGATAFVAATAVFKFPGGIKAGLEALRAAARID